MGEQFNFFLFAYTKAYANLSIVNAHERISFVSATAHRKKCFATR
jgi:hypothetical protein